MAESRNYSEEVAAKIDDEVQKLIREATVTANKVIRKNRTKLNLIAKTLLEKETIEGKDFAKLFDKIDKSAAKKDTQTAVEPEEE